MATTTQPIVRDRLFIGGEWVEPAGAETIEVINPSTEELVGRIPAGGADDVDRAVRAARAAFEAWAATDRHERARLCGAVGAAISERTDELASLVATELGMPMSLTPGAQVAVPALTWSSMPDVAEQVAWEEEQQNSHVVREAAGVVGAITPWNYPLNQIAGKAAPALTAGCTVVLKPSEVVPFNAFVLAEIIEAVGFPPGVFNLVSGYGPKAGEPLVSHPETDLISFTGSTRAGRRVSELGAAMVKPVLVELGGKSPNVILDDADLERAVTAGVGNCFYNSGQTCSALTRMLVPRERMEEAERIAAAAAEGYTPGDPFDEGTGLGPLVSETQLQRVRGYIEKGSAEGAKLVTGGAEPPEGKEQGYFVRPTVFSEVTSDMTIAQEEIFGPVLAIMPYEDEEDAVRIANDSIYGLSGGVWSGDDERARRVAGRIRTGQVTINGGAYNPLAPFGGYKQSGHGREFGRLGLEEFLVVKSLQL